MDAPVSDLLGIVREEITLYRDLVEHARRKTASLVQGSIEGVLESNKTDEAFSARLRSLEIEMARLCEQVGQAFQIPREGITLMKLADKIDPSVAQEIRSQIDLFRNLAQQLKTVNRRNDKLIERSLHYSKGLLGIFSNASGSYRQNGSFEQIPLVPPTFSQRA